MKVLKAKCKHCGKEITSMYPKQLDYNLKAHELSCEAKDSKRTTNENRGKNV